jgi:hypothetical protein
MLFLLVLALYPLKLNMKNQEAHFGLRYQTGCSPNRFSLALKRIFLALHFAGSIVNLKIPMT